MRALKDILVARRRQLATISCRFEAEVSSTLLRTLSLQSSI